VLGHGRGYRTFSVGYKVIKGRVDDAFDGAWQRFYNWIRETGLTFRRKDGTPMGVDFGFIDSGYRANTVYRFCKRLKGFYPSKGFQGLKLKKGDRFKRDIPTGRDKVKYRLVKLTSTFLYEIASVFYKDIIYANMTIERQNGSIQKPGFCDFPNDYDQKYFKELLAEEKSTEDGSYSARGRKNEALDCRVMALCSGDAYLDSLINEARDYAKKSGMSEVQIRETIDTPYVLSVLEKRLNQRINLARSTRKAG
jgi:phage terminase large subunit GpA-like protein